MLEGRTCICDISQAYHDQHLLCNTSMNPFARIRLWPYMQNIAPGEVIENVILVRILGLTPDIGS